MGLLIIILLGTGWGALWHYFIRREYWLVSVAAAIGAGGMVAGISNLLGNRFSIGDWIAISSFVLPGTLLGSIPVRLRLRRRPKPGVCAKCGYLLTGLPLPRCPECGLEFDPNATELVVAERPAFVLPIQVLFALVFLVTDGFIVGIIMFAGEENLFSWGGLWLWGWLGLSCGAVPLARRIKTQRDAVVCVVIVLAMVAGLVAWFSRYA